VDLSFLIRSTIGDEIDKLPYVPAHIKYEKLPGAETAFLYGSWGYIILQLIRLAGVHIWDTQYNLLRRIQFEGGSDKTFIEFHNAVQNFNPTQWKNNPLQYKAAGFGSISAGPYIHNIVTFEPGIYRTTDFHCEPAFLNCFANVYPKVDKMMSTDISKEFSQFDTAVRHKGMAGGVLRQVLNPKLRNGKLPVHYLGKVQEFMDHAFEEMDPPQIILPAALNNELREKAEAVEAILQAEFSEPIMLADLAQRVATNLTYLQRAFKERYNMTIMQYLFNIRIEKVKQYLLDTTDGLETIAGLTQFHDASHLSNKFKSATGETPTEFRNSWKK
jgi:AraC-like DNA-binding protein